jgi:hypothetical protein
MNRGLACMMAFALPMAFAQGPADSAEKTTASEIEQLKQMLLDQQRQINDLKQKLGMPVNAGVPVNAHAGIGEVASTAAVLPPAPVAPPTFGPLPVSTTPMPTPQIAAPGPDESGPLQLKLGDAYFTPIGFMDMTSVSRSTNPGTGIGTNFGSIPYGNTQTGSLTETRFSPQNSRIGLKIDTVYKDFKVTGWWESDFLGQTGNPPNGGIAVSSNPYVFRLRLFWADVQKGKNEFLAGQSWSLMTPGRVGISPIPGDIFYTYDTDVNYQAGLVWLRTPGFRYTYHATDKVTFAVALENSEPYVGGGNGGSAITAPAAFSSIIGTQVNNGTSVLSSAAVFPDVIAKVAFDPTKKFHAEIAGVEIANKISNPTTAALYQTDTKIGGGGSINLGFDLVPNVRIVTNNYWSAGGGRYIFGQAPDFVIRANGQLSLVHSGSTLSGFEITAKNTVLFGYYGGIYIARNQALDVNGSKIGYGELTSDGQNRAIQEITFGTNTTLAKNPKWGALNLMFQYSYLQRNPWLAAAGAPSNANLSMGFVNFRYTLPLYTAWSRLGKN